MTRRSLTSSTPIAIAIISLIAIALSHIVSAHVPPAPTTTLPPPVIPSSPSPPSTPTTPATPSSPPATPSIPSTPSSPPATPSTPSTPPAGGDVNDPPCCDVLKAVPGCKEQIFKTYTTIGGGSVSATKFASVNIGGSYVKLGSACCNIINTVGDGCWKMMFPKCPVAMFFRGVCSVFGAPELKPSLLNSMECLTALRQIPGCMKQVNETASLILQFGFKGAKTHKGMQTEVVGMKKECCQAAGGITDTCWKQMYPKYPAVPRVVKGVCSVVDGSGGGAGGFKAAVKKHREERMQKKQGSDNVNFDAKVVGPPVAKQGSDNVNFDAKLVGPPVAKQGSDKVNFDAKLVGPPVA